MPPYFTSPSEVKVKENLPRGVIAFYVHAKDQDEGASSHVTYSMAPHPQFPFSIDSQTGAMYILTEPNRETTPQYILEITAKDAGNPIMSTTQVITVYVEDVNDNGPVFDSLEYTKTLSESVPVGSTLMTVHASDNDVGLNGQVRYFVQGGEDDFSVDQSSGVVRVKKNLDFERKPSYKFKIQAEDRGSSPRSAVTTIKFTITDVNDKEPIFVDSPYYALVMENATSIPVSVITVTAIDPDSYPFNMVTYSIIDGNEENIFRIDNKTGEITCLRILDREVKADYTLIVRGKDYGKLLCTLLIGFTHEMHIV